ncbi:sensor histidine kinase [Gracilibacillus sp. YIM 98692]|uniref:cache domain-containing sensor histidine kinase n=1 Tax=Gracilibacillus sp. YIM 98692 TaxID=2663532 RepID=UPI0013D0AD3C|nr:sensor histidine kinase [Gracilibacillus sp. YIM 98692]
MKVHSIKKKLFLIFIFFVCLPISIIGYIWFETSTTTIEQEAIQSNKKLIQQVNDYLNLYISNIENSTYPFISNRQIQRFINSDILSKYDSFILSEQIEKELFTQMMDGRSDIVGISLVSKKGRQINFYQSTELLDMKHIRNRNNQLLQGGNEMDNFNIIGLREIGSQPVITVSRKIHSNHSYLYEALLIVDINLSQISNISNNLSIENSNVWIMDDTGQIIYHTNPNRIGEFVRTSVLNRYLSNTSDVFTTTTNNKKQIFIYEHFQATDWVLIAQLPHKKIISDLLKIRSLTILLGGVIVIVALSVFGGFSLSLTGSLSTLQKLMKKVELGNLTVPNLSMKERKDEIGNVFRSFYTMVNELKRLYEEVHIAQLQEKQMQIKQKESALQAMQAQINPHFLYNTLGIINSHAILENNMVISKMTTSLAHMFRYNLGDARQVVSLREEMDHIHSYLEIQKERHRHLEVDIQIDNECLDSISIIRLSLQPLVENAFLHGYQKHKRKASYIGIHTFKKSDYYVIQVIDNGYGMDPKIKEDYNRAFKELDDQHIYDKEKQFKSIGLWNVHERTRLAFGTPYGLHIKDGSSGTGTIVEIMLPYRKEEENDV